ncbi:TPA: hypothetical protein KRE78_002575 [Clostridioides difficile]|nr:hypothetical protein [Clostridioides difficile]
MFHALTYESMMEKLKETGSIRKCNIGILLCNPNSEFAQKEILSRVEQFYHASGEFIDFYFPGYGAYWNNEYPDRECVQKVNGVSWYFSEKKYREFIRKLESISKWKYNGESELLVISYNNGELDFSKSSMIWLDKSVKDGSIYSVSNEFERMFKEFERGRNIVEISDKFVLKSIWDVSLNYLTEKFGVCGKMFNKSKYIVTKDLSL